MDESVIEKVWDRLRHGIERIYNRPDEFSRKSRLDSISMEMCNCFTSFSDPGEGPCSGTRRRHHFDHGQSCPFNGDTTALYQLASGEIHARMQRWITTFVGDIAQEAQRLADDTLLKFVVAKWSRFHQSSKVLGSVFEYSKELLRGEDRCPYSMAMTVWRDYLLDDLVRPLVMTSLQVVDLHRYGDESVSLELVAGFVRCLVEMDGIATSEQRSRPSYKDWFEHQLIGVTTDYYDAEANRLLGDASFSFVDFANYVQQALEGEQRRAELFLHATVVRRLIDACQTVLVDQRIPLFRRAFDTLLRSGQTAGVEAVYRVVSCRDETTLDQLADVFSNFVFDEGQAAVTAYIQPLTAQQRHATEYIKVLLDIYKRYHTFVMLHFENTCCFVKAFDKAYGSLVNENALTKACSRTMSKTAEMLAQYCDQLLKRSRRRSADEIDDSLTDVIVIFGYLEDKHMFEARYRCLLAGRYLRNRVVNEDAERQMVSKLKECSGNMYTSHLQQMCRDVETSRAEMIEFRQQQAAMERPRDDTTSLDNINIRTIGYSYWPVQSLPSLSTGVPYEMTRRCAQFTQFYMNRHTGRTLTWLHEWSNGELATSCFGKQYNFRVTAFQMSVLLQYNDADRFTVKDLLNNTQMNATVLKDVLTSLVKHRVLLCDDDLSDDTRTLPDSAVFSLNLDYQSTTLSNNFISAAPRLTNESLYLKKITKEFRPYVVKAQIVNIMKQAGRLDHETLIRNVVERLRGYFQPPVSMIKNCIDELINQNYMKRVDDDSVGYCYVPEPYMLNAP